MKSLVVVAVLFLGLSAAVGEAIPNDKSVKAPVATTSTDISSRATVQVASIWVEHDKANTPIRLARPL